MRWINPTKSLGSYVNPYTEDPKHNLWDVILWRFGHYDDEELIQPPMDFHYPTVPRSFDPQLPSVIWIGHSTFLIQIDGLNILTDPLFSDHCSPIPIRALRRRHDPSIFIHHLPPIDLALISHNHYDHLDEKSVGFLHRQNPQMIWCVPAGVKRWFEKRKIESVFEYNWGEFRSFYDRCRITAVPAQHFSGRRIWDENRTLWCGYIFECANKTFYFVGDSGYNSIDFKNIGETWSKIDLSMIPIGAYAPKRLLQAIHVNPKEAVQIHCDVKSKFSLAMHWNTFCLSDEPMELPPYELYLAMKEKNLPLESFLPIKPGIQVNW